MKRSWLFALSALTLAACQTVPQVSTNLDPLVDFQNYTTYRWIDVAQPADVNRLNYDRIHAAIDAQLAAKGYRQVDKGDLAIAFIVGSSAKLRITDFGTYGGYYGDYLLWGPSVDYHTEQTLSINAYDVATQRPVWRAVTAQRADELGMSADALNVAVASAMMSFPARALAPVR